LRGAVLARCLDTRAGVCSNMNDLVSGAHSVFQCVYHIEWCPKYRFNVLGKPSHKEDMEAILQNIATEHDMQIEELAVMPDHVHIVVHVQPSVSLAYATQLLKGRSSYEFFKKHPNLRKRYWDGHFWSKGKFYRSVGSVDLKTTKEYVKNQVDIHQAILPAF
jgi:putative transposase